jgi:hypothetical protein
MLQLHRCYAPLIHRGDEGINRFGRWLRYLVPSLKLQRLQRANTQHPGRPASKGNKNKLCGQW